jgi:hypothetical protein
MDVYITHDGGNHGQPIGANDGSGWAYIEPTYSGNNFSYDLNGNTFPSAANTSDVGLWSISRISSASVSAYKNGASFTSTTDTSTNLLNADPLIGASYDYDTADQFSNDTIAMASIGGGLTGTQEAAKAQCDDAYATSKGFNVF